MAVTLVLLVYSIFTVANVTGEVLVLLPGCLTFLGFFNRPSPDPFTSAVSLDSVFPFNRYELCTQYSHPESCL